MTAHLDFSIGKWRLRNGAIVTGLIRRDSRSKGLHWRDPETNHCWNLDGDHIGHLGESLGNESRSTKNQLLDIVQRLEDIRPEPKRVSAKKFYDGRTYVVTGGSSGLGRAIVKALLTSSQKCQVYNFDLAPLEPLPDCGENILHNISVDLSVPISIDNMYDIVRELDVLINCAGINAIEWFEKLELNTWERVMDVNARAIFLMSRALLPLLKASSGTILNIVSNASHIPMTNSLAYNASKAAAHMMTLQMARELTKLYGITVFGISPNKMAGTEMSRYIESRVPELRGWTPERAAEYQRAALLTGEETDVDTVAEFITWLLAEKRRHKYLSGCVLPYGA